MININQRLKLLLRSAKKRNIKVDLNIEHYRDIMKDPCSYCKSSLENEKGYCLDRYDNSIGYTTHNVVGCCKICNYAKRGMSCTEFYNWIDRIANAKKEVEKSVNNTPKELQNKIHMLLKKQKNIYMNQSRIKNSEVLTYVPDKINYD